jgi:hypothetical protein
MTAEAADADAAQSLISASTGGGASIGFLALVESEPASKWVNDLYYCSDVYGALVGGD